MEPECHDLHLAQVHLSSCHPLSLPTTDDAGPRQVRQYLVDHLMSKHDTSLEFAKNTADLWHLGRGVDFRKATVAAYIEAGKKYDAIFGHNITPYLLRSVREDCYNQWRASSLGTRSFWTIIACVTISFLLFLWTFSQARFAKNPILYLFRNACWPIGPPILVCAYLETGHSFVFPILLWLLGIYGTLAGLLSTIFVLADEAEEAESTMNKPKQKADN